MASVPQPGPPGEPAGEDHLWDYVAVVLRHRKFALAIFLTATSVATIRTLLTRPVYMATAQILIERENPNVLTFKDVTEVNAAARRLLPDPVQPAAEPIAGAPGRREPEPAPGPGVRRAARAGAGQGGAGRRPRRLADHGRGGRRRARPSPDQRWPRARGSSAWAREAFRPDLAMNIANKLSQLYIQQTLEFRYQTSSEAGQWLGTQIDQQRKKVEEGHQELQKLKEREGIVNIEERRTLLDQKLNQLGTALTDARTTRLSKEALYRQMRSSDNPEDLSEVMRDPVVQRLRMEQADLEAKQAQLLEKYLEQHPEVVKVKREIDEIRKKIAAESQRVIRSAENDYKAAAAQEASLSARPRGRQDGDGGAGIAQRPLRHGQARRRRGPQRAEQPDLAPQGDGRRPGAERLEHPHRGPGRDAARPHPPQPPARHHHGCAARARSWPSGSRSSSTTSTTRSRRPTTCGPTWVRRCSAWCRRPGRRRPTC